MRRAVLIMSVLAVGLAATAGILAGMAWSALAAVIHAALETVRPAAEARGVRLETDLPEDVPVLSGDPVEGPIIRAARSMSWSTRFTAPARSFREAGTMSAAGRTLSNSPGPLRPMTAGGQI
jgi:signal transduction histidine kinase